MSDAEKKAKEQKRLEEQAAKEVAEKKAIEAAEKEAAEKEAKQAEAEKKKAAEQEELNAAQAAKKAALVRKPVFWVIKSNLKHNGIFYPKGYKCPDSKIEEFKAKGFIEQV